MTNGLASNTWTPTHGATSAVYWPCSSIGTMVGMPLALLAIWSSSPKPGAMCTTPVPSSIVTKSAPRTRNACSVPNVSVSVKKSNSGV